MCMLDLINGRSVLRTEMSSGCDVSTDLRTG